MLHLGLGGYKNIAEARVWYEKAAALGETNAQRNLADMDRRGTRGSGSRGGGGGGYSRDSSPGLSGRGRPCYLPSEQGIGC
jgi:TPR repeat protein